MSAINNYSPARASRLPFFKRTKDHCAGVDRIKGAGAAYLPPQEDMTDHDYRRYLDSTLYFPGAARTLNMFSGLVFRKEYTISAPQSLHSIKDVITTDGKTLEQMLKWAFREYCMTNDGGFLVIHPVVPEGASLADVYEQDLRPFIAPFSAEAILEISYGVRRGRKALSRVRLREREDAVLDLYLENGVYTMARHIQVDGEWQRVEISQPLMQGQPMSYIPFVSLGDGEDISPFDDLAALNQTHYLKSAALELALIYLSRPKLVICGVKDDVELTMSINSMWRFEDKDTKVEYLEFKASGLSLLKDEVKNLTDALGIMGSRMLAIEEKAAAEAAETVARRQASENATLAGFVRHTAACAETTLKIVAEWMGEKPDVSLALNTDFLPQSIDAGLLGQVIALYQAGRIPNEVLFQILRDGEVLPESLDYETYAALLEMQEYRHDEETFSASVDNDDTETGDET